jgi:nitroreductase
MQGIFRNFGFLDMNIEELNALIKRRRSVFPDQYTGEPVDDSVIAQILENACWAPNHGKTEPWRFFVFSGDALQQLGEYHAALYQKITPPEAFQESKFEKLRANPAKASHVIALGMKRQESEKIPEIEEIEAVACAVQNMYLSVTAFGLGGYWASGGATYSEEIKELFGLGQKDRFLGFFYIGVPKGPLTEGARKPLAEKVTWIRDMD